MTIEAGSHLYPYRTQKLSPRSPMVLRGFSLGRVGRCQDREEEGESTDREVGALFRVLFNGDRLHFV